MSIRRKDIHGKKFGTLTVKAFAGLDNSGSAYWNCLCICGRVKRVRGSSLRNGDVQTCTSAACRAKLGIQTTYTTHGGTGTPEFQAWHNMKQRCENPNHRQFHVYGGRGIQVCARWASFENFLADMGPRPSPDHSIDRYPDQNGNYCPENCRWATQKQQTRNMRRNVNITYRGVTRCATDWAILLGLDPSTIIRRHRLRWSVPDILSPRRHNCKGVAI